MVESLAQRLARTVPGLRGFSAQKLLYDTYDGDQKEVAVDPQSDHPESVQAGRGAEELEFYLRMAVQQIRKSGAAPNWRASSAWVLSSGPCTKGRNSRAALREMHGTRQPGPSRTQCSPLGERGTGAEQSIGELRGLSVRIVECKTVRPWPGRSPCVLVSAWAPAHPFGAMSSG